MPATTLAHDEHRVQGRSGNSYEDTLLDQIRSASPERSFAIDGSRAATSRRGGTLDRIVEEAVVEKLG